MSTVPSVDRIGVGIDTARYGHRVSFLRPDRQPAANPLTVMEDRAGYQALRQRLEQLHQQHPGVHFNVRIDAAGQYAANLEHFLRSLSLPMTVSIGEPKRNKDTRKPTSPNAPATIPKARPWHASPSSSSLLPPRPPRRP